MALVGTLQWLVYLLGLCGPAVSVLPCCSSHPVRQAQSEFTCGRDCLFIWLGLNNISVDQETLSGVVSVGASGSSLHELQLAATQFGLPSEVVDFGGGGLSTLPLPAIVHVQIPNQELGGHFVVLVNRSLGRVFVIDPDLPKVVAMDEAELALIATGYALVSREGMRGTSMFWRQLAFVSIVGLTIVALLAIFRSLRKSRIVLGLVLFVLFGGGCDSDVQEGFVDGKSSTEPVELSKAALSWGQNSKDFGLVVEPEVEVKFLLRNESSDLVELFLSEVSCACLTAKLNKREMLPGEQIEVVLTLSHGAFQANAGVVYPWG
ncbi:MAG: DUF1573 domain-containing protein [Planctomycetaceae bacterium]|nr:DUF1573 domain-containing protein [Planctomycetaceae bacterium]